MESTSHSLDSMPEEIQINILRILLLSNGPIELDPFNPVVPGTVPAGNMSIARVSKHFSYLALRIFYGENCFALPSTEEPTPPPIDPRWLKLHAYTPQSPEPPDTSLGCLNHIQASPMALQHMSQLHLHLGQCGITCFYSAEHLSRLGLMGSLSTVRFVLEPGWERVLEPRFGEGFMDAHEKEILYPDFARGFARVVEAGLARVRCVGVVERVRGRGSAGRVVDFLEALLGGRNRGWEMRKAGRRMGGRGLRGVRGRG